MTDYEQVKAEIGDLHERLRQGGDDDPTDKEEINLLWGFVRQLQEIIEAANTEPEPDLVPFHELNRGEQFRLTTCPDVCVKSGQRTGYELVDDLHLPSPRMRFMTDTTTLVERV